MKRKLLASVFAAKSLRKTLEHSAASKEQLREEKRRILREKLKQGLAGQRFGKHTVQKAKIDVQLGEDLTDSLRGLKVSFWYRQPLPWRCDLILLPSRKVICLGTVS